MNALAFKSGNELSTKSILTWRIVQAVVWLLGAFIVTCLLFFPSLGIILFWNILIPVAPALFVFGAGVWRNVCPLATTSLLPRHMGWSKRKRLSVRQSGLLSLIAVFGLYLVVPLRHAVFNNNGAATAILLISTAATGITAGFFYEWKSVWCSGLCPVHPVEKLYGRNVLLSLPNAHCDQCRNCIVPCPDATVNSSPLSSSKTIYHRLSGLLIAGGLPGFIWGWFHVPDEATVSSFSNFLSVYSMPFMGLCVTLAIYMIVSKIFPGKAAEKITDIFAAAGVSCYYWYRIPSLFGFGKFAKDGLLVDLSAAVPAWIITVSTVLTTFLFFYWLVFRKQHANSWVVRPPFEHKDQNQPQSALL